jgi:hypothetical protein
MTISRSERAYLGFLSLSALVAAVVSRVAKFSP